MKTWRNEYVLTYTFFFYINEKHTLTEYLWCYKLNNIFTFFHDEKTSLKLKLSSFKSILSFLDVYVSVFFFKFRWKKGLLYNSSDLHSGKSWRVSCWFSVYTTLICTNRQSSVDSATLHTNFGRDWCRNMHQIDSYLRRNCLFTHLFKR